MRQKCTFSTLLGKKVYFHPEGYFSNDTTAILYFLVINGDFPAPYVVGQSLQWSWFQELCVHGLDLQ